MPNAFQAAIYNPSEHHDLLQTYMLSTSAENNRSPRQFRLEDYDGVKGVLFLIIDSEGLICAVSSVVVVEGRSGPAAKIYGRFNIERRVPHTVIDQYFEPMTFQWCLDRGIDNLFLTVNAGRYEVLDWACRRMGERRNLRRPNVYNPELGRAIRTGFKPLNNLIYERHCWQYAIYYSPSGEWFLDRQTQPLDANSVMIFKREFPNATQNWA